MESGGGKAASGSGAMGGKPPSSGSSSKKRAPHKGRSSAPALERTAGSPLSSGSAAGSALGSARSAREVRPQAGPKRLSSLDLMRMKIDAQITACPRDERKTREYLQRQKVACGLTLSRRVVGRPDDDTLSSLDGHSIASAPSEHGNDTLELPRLSASAPPSPHQRIDGSPRRPEEVRKSRPRWEAAHSLSKDKSALTSRARMEGDVEVQFKIPYGVTWSAEMCTKPRVWCDFILDRPKRMWNWGKKLEKIQDETEAGAAQCQTASLRGLAASGWADESAETLKTVVGSLCTRQDVADAHHAKKMAVKAERTLRRLFALSIQKKGISAGMEENPAETAIQHLLSGALWAIGPEDTESDVDELAVPEGVIDMRAFSLLLTRLNVFNESVSKTTALNIIADIKGENKNISFTHFRAALKKVLTLGGKTMVEVMCMNREERPVFERSADPLEEALREHCDQHIMQERKVLKTIIDEIQTISSGPPSGKESVSTYGLREQEGAFVVQEEGKGQPTIHNGEAPLLLDLRDMLDGMEDKLQQTAIEDASASVHRELMDQDLRGIMSAATENMSKIFESHSEASSPLKSSAGSPLPKSPLPRPGVTKSQTEAALNEASARHILEVQDTRKTMDEAIHLVRLTKGRAKAPLEDLDRGDIYFTDSESEEEASTEEETALGNINENLSSVEAQREGARNKMQAALELMHADEDDPNIEAEALDLIENVCKECGVECDVSFVAKIMRGVRSPWESMKHDLIDLVKRSKRSQAMSALIRSLQHTAEHDSIMAILKYFLRELRSKRPGPRRDPSWGKFRHLCVCVCVCVRNRVGEGASERASERERDAPDS